MNKATSKKTVLTGIKPTAHPHIGNYLGAIRPGIELMKTSDKSLLFIADYHAVTTIHDPRELKELTYSVTATWLACGLDPKKAIIYRQSDIPEIFENAWILSCMTAKGLMNRAHAYKAKLQENQESGKEDPDDGVSMGLYSYPVLMASDILSFESDFVPVGSDQVQHVEIARDIAQKFNRTYGPILKLPQHVIKTEKLIPGLDGRKMSKSYGNTIPLFLESDKLRKLVMKIITDSLPPEAPKETKDSTLYELYKEFAGESQVKELEQIYKKGIGWGHVKQMLFEAMESHLKPMREIYNSHMANTQGLDQILEDGASQARAIAKPLLGRIREAVRGLK